MAPAWRNVKRLRCPIGQPRFKRLLFLRPKLRKMVTKKNQGSTICQVFFYKILIDLIFTTNLCNIDIMNPFFPDEKTEAQNSDVICPRGHIC